jgi:hypothetical protein
MRLTLGMGRKLNTSTSLPQRLMAISHVVCRLQRGQFFRQRAAGDVIWTELQTAFIRKQRPVYSIIISRHEHLTSALHPVPRRSPANQDLLSAVQFRSLTDRTSNFTFWGGVRMRLVQLEILQDLLPRPHPPPTDLYKWARCTWSCSWRQAKYSEITCALSSSSGNSPKRTVA